MKIKVWLVLGILLFAAGCGGDDENIVSEHEIIQTLTFNILANLSVVSGAFATFPANTYDTDAIVIFSDIFTSNDSLSSYYPTATKAAGDLLGSCVINTPADRVMQTDLTVGFKLLAAAQAASQVTDVVAGAEYAVYRFDFDNMRWNRWGDTYVTVDAGRSLAVGTLPTMGMRGFIGSIAIFRGHDMPSLPAVVPTTISGTVYAQGGASLATDVGIYTLVGAVRYPSAITNGRIPNATDPSDTTLMINVANTVNSGANGTFTMEIPDNLIGQLVGFEFGREDTGLNGEDEFNVLLPASPVNEVTYMIVRYGENNIASRPVD